MISDLKFCSLTGGFGLKQELVATVTVLLLILSASPGSFLEKDICAETTIQPNKAREASTSQIEKNPPGIAPVEIQTLPLPQAIKKEIGQTKLVTTVTCSKSSFNPSLDEEIALSYELKDDATVTVHVYDPDNGLVKTLLEKVKQEAGKHTVVWDGCDLTGSVVPDEAYYFTIETEDLHGTQHIYDPTTFSGGESKDVLKSELQPETQTVVYQMPEMGRVNIRIGTKGGPLLKTLVDWKPRVTGQITEYWNGMDEDNLMDLTRNPKSKMVITYFTLPENTVITYGNKTIGYRQYKQAVLVDKKRPQKPERPRVLKPKSPISLHYTRPRTEDYAPSINVTLPHVRETDDGVPVLKGRVLVRVELGETESFLTEQRYEITFFLDGLFYAEDEAGYTPYNWVWDVTDVKAGEHILTVNLSSFKDQIGVRSLKVKVVK